MTEEKQHQTVFNLGNETTNYLHLLSEVIVNECERVKGNKKEARRKKGSKKE